jgi:hypothetical protein
MAPIENEASVSLTRGVAYEYQPASPAHDRRHDYPAYRGEGAEGLHPLCQENLAVFLGRSPETADLEDLRRFRLHLIDSSLSVSSVNTAMQALRFLFSVTLDRLGLLKALFRVQGPQKLPTVLTQEEVARLLECASSAKLTGSGHAASRA